MSPRVLLAVIATSWFVLTTTSPAQIAARADAAPAAEPAGAIVAAPPVSARSYPRTEIPRFEIGVQTTMLRTPGQTGSCGGCLVARFAVGPAITINLHRYFALDAVASFFPAQSLPGENYGGRLGQALAGVKASIHGAKWTLFTKARPGVMSWSNTLREMDVTALRGQPSPGVRAVFGRATSFALDVGGGFEYRLTPAIALRGEMGETFVRETPLNWSFNNGAPQSGGARFLHRLQTGTGVYYRLGRRVAFAESGRSGRQHEFFDRTNVVLMTMSMLAQSADAITTQRALSDCRKTFAAAGEPTGPCAQVETNPIARPFVSRGWPGQIGLGAMVNSAQILLMYSIHKMGHHRIERIAALPLTFASGVMAYSNLQPK